MDQIDLIPSGVTQATSQQVCAAGIKYACYCSPLAVYVYDIQQEGTPLLRVLSGPDRPMGGIASDGKLVLAACSDRTIFCWDIEKGTRTTDMLGNPYKMPTCFGNPNCVAAIKPWCFVIGCDNGILMLYNALDNECIKATLANDSAESNITALGVITLADSEKAILVGTNNGRLYFVSSSTGKRLGDYHPFKTIREEKQSLASKLFGSGSSLSSNEAIVAIVPDALSPGFVLVACRDSTMCLMDFSPCQAHNISGAKVVYRYAGDSPVTSVSFATSIPGAFYTTDGRSPTISEWHVTSSTRVGVQRPQWSQNESSATSDVAITSILSIAPKWLVMASRNGSVCFYDNQLRRPQLTNPSGHSETVFECRFSHHDKDLFASGSFDGTIKLWNLRHMTLVRNIETRSNIYSIAWSPCGGFILAGMSNGLVGVFDTNNGATKWLVTAHSDVAWRVTWNVKEPSIVATSSRDRTVAIIESDSGTVLQKIEHAASVYGIDFDPFHPFRLAVGCFDTIARIFDLKVFKDSSIVSKSGGFFFTSTATPAPAGVIEMVGHSQDVYNVAFSPLVENLLLTGSNDLTARVWDVVSATTIATFEGHIDRVRALAWSHLSPSTVLTGSWDGSVKVWDIKSERCVSSAHHHSSDVYTLASHPKRPCVFISGSRDTTIRVWNMTCAGVAAGLYAVLSNFTKAAIDMPQQLTWEDSHNRKPAQAPSNILEHISAAGDKAAKLSAILEVFTHPHGGSDVAQCASYFIDPATLESAAAQQATLASPMRRKISAISDHRSSLSISGGAHASSNGFATPAPLASIAGSSVINTASFQGPQSPTSQKLSLDGPVVPQDILMSVAETKAAELSRIKNRVASSAGVSQRVAKLRKAADANLFINNIEAYCELLIEAGDWERALAAAPAVSASYWRQLCLRGAEKAAETNESSAAGFFICAQQGHKAADMLASRGDFVNASVVVQKCHQVDNSQPFPEGSVPFNPPQVSAFESATKLVQLAKRQSATYATRGNPFLAAAALIASKAPEEAITTLIVSGEVVTALAIALAVYGGSSSQYLMNSKSSTNYDDGVSILEETLGAAAAYAAFLGHTRMSAAIVSAITSSPARLVAAASAMAITMFVYGSEDDQKKTFMTLVPAGAQSETKDDIVGKVAALLVSNKVWDANVIAEKFMSESIKTILNDVSNIQGSASTRLSSSGSDHQPTTVRHPLSTTRRPVRWATAAQWLPYKSELLKVRALALCLAPHVAQSANAPAPSPEWEGIQRSAYIAGAGLAEIFGFGVLAPRLLNQALTTFGDSSVVLGSAKKELRVLLQDVLTDALSAGHRQHNTDEAASFLIASPLGSQLPTNTPSGDPAFSFFTDVPITGPFIVLQEGSSSSHQHSPRVAPSPPRDGNNGSSKRRPHQSSLLEEATEEFPLDCVDHPLGSSTVTTVKKTDNVIVTKKEALQWYQCCTLSPTGSGKLFNPYQ